MADPPPERMVGVANPSPIFSLQVGDIPVRIHDTFGPFRSIECVDAIFRRYPYRLVRITVARGDAQTLVDAFVTPDAAGALASLEWGLFSGPHATPPESRYLTGPVCVTGHPYTTFHSLLVVGLVVTGHSHEGFRMGDILLQIHTTQGPFHEVDPVLEILRPLKWRMVEVEVQRGGRQVTIQACPDSRGMLHNVQLELMQASGMQVGTDSPGPSESSGAPLEAWLQEIGIPDSTIHQYISQLMAAGITLENLPSLTEDNISSLGMLEPELRDIVLGGIVQLTRNGDRVSPAVGLPAVLQVTSASLPVTTH